MAVIILLLIPAADVFILFAYSSLTGYDCTV